jgi:hypothetical protein
VSGPGSCGGSALTPFSPECGPGLVFERILERLAWRLGVVERLHLVDECDDGIAPLGLAHSCLFAALCTNRDRSFTMPEFEVDSSVAAEHGHGKTACVRKRGEATARKELRGFGDRLLLRVVMAQRSEQKECGRADGEELRLLTRSERDRVDGEGDVTVSTLLVRVTLARRKLRDVGRAEDDHPRSLADGLITS